MIPLADDNVGRRIFPWVNWSLIALNVAMFLYQSLMAGAAMQFVLAWGMQPYEIVRLDDLQTLLTAMFLHGGIMHLLGNMLYLHVFGDNVEEAMGHGRYLLFYLLCGLAANVAQIAVDPNSRIPVIGASGAISGVLGAYLVLFPMGRVKALVLVFVTWMPAWVLLGFYLLYQLGPALSSFGERSDGGTAFMAHVGGFVAGMVLAKVFADPDEVRRQRIVREQHRAMRRRRMA